MTGTLIKAVVASIPVTVFLWHAVVTFASRRSVASVVQLTGASAAGVVIVAHVCEALHLLPWFGWGQQQSVGHYIDLLSAILAVTLLPLGYVFHRRQRL